MNGKPIITEFKVKQPSDTYNSNEPKASFELAFPTNNFLDIRIKDLNSSQRLGQAD
jgi:hypothetical protein